MNSYIIGTAPFCAAQKEQCYATPGYKPGEQISNGCLFGNKIRCVWDQMLWQNSGLYNQLLRDGLWDKLPTFKWFGTAPTCIVSNCDVVKDGYIPISYDLCGDGSCCITSEKILGLKPMNKKYGEILDDLKKQC